MKRFSELGIEIDADRHIFPVPQVSITDILNCEIEILDFESGVKTQHGSDRYVVKIKHEGTECKFFTNSTPIKEALSKISKKRLSVHYNYQSEEVGSWEQQDVLFYLTKFSRRKGQSYYRTKSRERSEVHTASL